MNTEQMSSANPSASSGANPVAPWRRWLHLLRNLLVAGLLLSISLGLVGQIVRDRTRWLGLLFYVPLLPFGLLAIILDLASLGKALRRPRFALAAIGLSIALFSAWLMIETGQRDPVRLDAKEYRLVQWNIHWGGGKHRTLATWEDLTNDIAGLDPDIIVLSEAPGRPNLNFGLRDTAIDWLEAPARERNWNWVQCEHQWDNPYWYRLAVCSPWKVRKEYDRDVTHGHVMSVLIEAPERPLRLLVVDGESNPLLSRVAFLEDVAEICRQASADGAGVDILAGDFNTPGRSRGFDALPDAGEGYRLASSAALGWRATYPSIIPLYDIDHVWLRRDFTLRGCKFLWSPQTDHRGQCVRFQISSKR